MPITGVPATVAAIYNTAAGQSIPNLTTPIVNFETKVQDTHNAVTTGATWTFTAPVSGFYQVSASIQFVATDTWADGELGNLRVNVNTVTIAFLDQKDNYGSATSIAMQLNGSTVVYLNANDYVSVLVRQDSGAALALSAAVTRNRISIVKV